MRRLLLIVLAALAAVLAVPGTASARASFDFSLPTNGASVGTPVERITIGFTEPVTLVGNGFTVLTPQGTELLPFPITDDDRVFRLILDPPLGGGEVSVDYQVIDEGGRTLSGSFSFNVDAEVPTTTTSTSTTTTSTTTTSTTTTAAATTSTSTTAVPATIASTVDSVAADGGGDSDSSGLYLALAAAVIVAAAGFLLVRRRAV